MRAKRLTPRQAEVLNLIRHGLETTNDIANHLGCRQQAAGELVLALYRRGLVTREAKSDGKVGRPSHHYYPVETPTPPPASERRALLRKLQAACLEHPELAFFMANPDAPVADPTFTFSNTDKRGHSSRYRETLPTL